MALLTENFRFPFIHLVAEENELRKKMKKSNFCLSEQNKKITKYKKNINKPNYFRLLIITKYLFLDLL